MLALSVLPESIMRTHWFAVLSNFVAINTVIYVSLSIFKIMPKLYLNDIVKQHGRRAETRSIYPNGHSAPEPDEPAKPGLAATSRAGRPPRGAATIISTPAGVTAVAVSSFSESVGGEKDQERRRIGDEPTKRQRAIARFPRSYQRWSESEEADLCRHVEKGFKLEQIAALHQRSPAATNTRIRRLGLSLDRSTSEDTDPFFEAHAAGDDRELTTTGG